jgi:hypothetical protein
MREKEQLEDQNLHGIILKRILEKCGVRMYSDGLVLGQVEAFLNTVMNFRFP